MSNKEPRDALEARDGETLLEAAKRVVRERDEARAKMELFRHDFKSRDRQWAEECLRGVSLERRLQEARAEVERLKAQHLERHLESWEQHMQDNDVKQAYRRGAEAMRKACAVAGQEACRNYIACGEVVADAIRALPIPEEP